VEAGIAAIALRERAVLRLRLIGLEVFEIAGSVDRMRPDKIGLRREAVPGVHLQAGLKGVIHRVGGGFFLIEVEEIGRNSARHTVARRAINLVGDVWDTRQIRRSDLCLARLVDIQELKQLGSLGTDVSDLKNNA